MRTRCQETERGSLPECSQGGPQSPAGLCIVSRRHPPWLCQTPAHIITNHTQRSTKGKCDSSHFIDKKAEVQGHSCWKLFRERRRLPIHYNYVQFGNLPHKKPGCRRLLTCQKHPFLFLEKKIPLLPSKSTLPSTSTHFMTNPTATKTTSSQKFPGRPAPGTRQAQHDGAGQCSETWKLT